MKPEGFETWSEKKKRDYALKLAQSMRGQYIISQALTKAIEVMKTVEPAVRRERSNIEDMETLRDNLFPLFYVTEQAECLLMEK